MGAYRSTSRIGRPEPTCWRVLQARSDALQGTGGSPGS